MSWLIIGIPGSQQEHGLVVRSDSNEALHELAEEESFIKANVGDPMKKNDKVPAILHVSILFQ